MNLSYLSNFSQEQLRSLQSIAMAPPKTFVPQSMLLFSVGDETEDYMIGGVFAESFLSDTIYLWVGMFKKVFTLPELRLLQQMFYTKARAETSVIRAEAAPDQLAAQKFLRFMGFIEIDHLDDRIVYEWNN